MPDGWIPGLEWRPGRNAGYRAGRVDPRVMRMHFTAGRESTAIGDQGFFTFLIHDEPGRAPSQFAEWDALTWDACEWNPVGVGIELERMSWDQPLIPDQVAWAGYIVGHLHVLTGGTIPLSLHADPRLPVGDNYRGWTNHAGLHENACDEHYDGVTDEEWAAILAHTGLEPAVALSEADFDRINLIVLGHILDLAGGANLDGTLVSTRLLEQKIDALPAPGPGGGSLTEDQVRAVVRAELDKTKLGH